MEGALQLHGAPSWLIFDPVRHRYFQIDEKAVHLLRAWKHQTPASVLEHCTHDDVSLEDIETLARFLMINALTVDPPAKDSRNLAAQADAAKRSLLSSVVHNYLFIRIPLVRPHAFLKRTLPFTNFLFDKRWWIFVCAIALTGLYLTARQWDQFTATFLHFFNIKGLALYFTALIFVKIIHELGHAYAATRYGGRVATMGVAFLVMFPVLFTDTTDSWKLTSKRKRLIINAAGVAMELTIAAFATLLWAFLPEGPWRSAAFIIATTSWVMSLAVNLNPLMRFDGYYFFADAIGIQNLQARSFALGRWALREVLFGLNDPVPEAMAHGRRRSLVLFAWATWIYRFFLFLGIALLIHAVFFKALGIILFWIEIGWFILMPIFSEMKIWWERRSDIIANARSRTTAAALAALLLTAFIPWQTTIRMPAVMEAQDHAVLYPSRAAKIDAIHVSAGDRVSAGDMLMELSAPALDHEIGQTERRLTVLHARLNRIAVDTQDRDQKIVLQQERLRTQKKLDGLKQEAAALNITAPFDGVVADLDPTLHKDRWLRRTDPLVSVIAPAANRVRGYVSVENVQRLPSNAEVVFIPETRDFAKATGAITTIAGADADEISIPALASRYGGSIAVADQQETLEPLQTWYSVTASLSSKPVTVGRVVRGQLHARGKPESLAAKIWRRTMRVLVIETSL